MEEGVYWLKMVMWTQVYAWATIVTGLVLIATLIRIIGQQRAYNKTQELQGFVQVIDWLEREEVRRARHRIYELEKTDIKDWSKEDRWEVEKVCHNFDAVGDMLDKKLINKRVLENWGLTIKRCWEIAGPLIQQYREERPHPGLWRHFQWLAEEVL